MCVALSSDVAIASFYSSIAQKINEQGKEFSEIFKVRFKPERIIEFAHILKHYDDITRCFTKESLTHSFEKEWEAIFDSDSDGYVHLKENSQLITNDGDYAHRIVVYLVHQMRSQLNNYPPGFLRKAGIL